MSLKYRKLKIRKGDEVVVMRGADAGKRGKVLRIIPKDERVVVENVRMVKKHQRPTPQNPQGGIVEKEAPIHLSNVMLVDPEKGEPTRVGRRKLDDGSTRRYAKKSGATIES